MKEIILRILRKTSLTDAEKLKEIFEFLDQDDSKFYGFNKLVKLSSDEFKKLNDTYGSIAIQKMIHNLDKYVYET